MHPLFITGLILAGVTALAMPYYCKITYKGKSSLTLAVKMILSTLFVVTVILALFSYSPRQGFMYVFPIGFFACYVGDYILGRSEHTKDFIAGSCCFALGHALYAVAFSLAQKKLFPQISWFNGFEIGLFLVIVSVMLLIILLKKPAIDPMLVLMFVYCLLVTLMLTKATGLAIRMLPDAPAMILAPIGGVCFLCSDYMLGMMRFKMHEKTVVFKSVCTVLYYAAQTLIALSMFILVRY